MHRGQTLERMCADSRDLESLGEKATAHTAVMSLTGLQ